MASNPFSTGSNGRPKGSAFSPSEFTNPLNRERYEDAIREDLRRKKQEESDFYTQQDQQIRLANDAAKAQADALKKQREAQERAAKEAAEYQKKWRNTAMEREAAVTGRGYLTDAFGDIQWDTDDETWQKQQENKAAERREEIKKKLESDRQAGIELQKAKYKNSINQLEKQQEHMREIGYDAESYDRDVESLPKTRAELIENLYNAGAFDSYVDSLPEEQQDSAYQAIDAGEVEEEMLTGLKKTNPTAFLEYDKKQKRIEAGAAQKERYDSLTQRIQRIEKDAGMTGPVATTEEALRKSASVIDEDRLALEQLIEERNTRVSFSDQDNARRLAEIEEIQAKLTGDGATAEEISKLRDDELNGRLSMLSKQKQEDEKINDLNAQIEYKTDLLNAAVKAHNESLEDLIPTTDSSPASRETKPGAAALKPETPTPSASPSVTPETPSRPLDRFGMDLIDGDKTVATIEEDDEHDRVVIIKDFSRVNDILVDPRRTRNAKPVYLPTEGTRRPSAEVKSEIEGLKAEMEKLSNRLKETGNTSEEEMTEVQNRGTQAMEKALREFGRGEISVDQLNSIGRAARLPDSGVSLYEQYIYKPSLIEKEEAAKVRARVESSKVSEEPFSFPKYAKMAIRQAFSTDLGGTLPKGSGLLAEPLLSKVGLSRGSARDQMIQELTEFNAAAEKIYEENMEYFHESTSRMGLSDEDAATWTMQQIYDAMPRRKQGAGETAIKVLNNLDEYSAFIGGFNKIDNFSPLLELQYKLDNGKELTEQDRKLAEWWASQDQRDKDVWAQVIEIGAVMPGFMAEILATGGTSSVVRKGGEKLAGKVVGEKIKDVFKKEFAVRARNEAKRAFTKKIIDEGANKAAIAAARKKAAISKMDLAEESLMNLPRHAVEAAIQTPLARGSHIVHDALKNANIADYSNAHPDIESWLRSPGEPVTQAILGAGFDNYAELLSEKLGAEIVKVGAFTKLPKDWQDKLAKLGLVKAFRRLNAGLSDTEVGGIMRRAEWHGWMTEVAEERVGDAIRALGYTASGGYIGEEFRWPTRDQWIAEIIAMSLPGGAAFAANETHMRMVDSSVRKEWEKAIAFGEQSLKSDPADLADKYNEQRPDQETLTPEQIAAGQEMFGTNNLAEVDAMIAKAEASYEKARSEGNTKALKVIGEQIRQMKAARGIAAAGSAGRSAVLAQQYTEQLAEAEARVQEAWASGDKAAFEQAQADIEAINQKIEARRQIFSAPVQEQGPTPTVETEGNQTTSTPENSASTESKSSRESDAANIPADNPASEAESPAPEATSTTEPGASPEANEAGEQARQERINNLKFYAEDAGVSEQEAQRLAEDYVNRNPEAKDAGVEGANLKFEINKNAERVEALVKSAGGRPLQSDEVRRKAEEFVANNPESRGAEEVPAFLASLQNEDGTGIPPVVPETKERETAQSESTPVTSDESHARAKDSEFKFRDINTVTQKGQHYIRLIQAELKKLGPSFINSIVLYEATPGDGDSGMFFSIDENGIGRIYIDPNRLAERVTESKLLKSVGEEWIHSFVTSAVSRADAIAFWNAMPEKLKEKTRRSYYHALKDPPKVTTDTEKYQMFHEFMRMVLQEKGIKLRDGKVLIEEGSVTEFDISPSFADAIVKMLKKLKREFERALKNLKGDLKEQMDAYVGRVDDLINEVNKASSNQDTSRSQQTGSPSPTPSFDNLFPTVSRLKENPIAAKPPGLDLRIRQARERGKQPNPRDLQLRSDYDGQPTLSEFSGPAKSALQGVFVRQGGMQPDQAASLLDFDSVDEMYEAIRQELNGAGASMQGLTKEQRNLIEEAKAAGLTVEEAREMAGAEGVAFNQKMTDVYLSAAPSIAPDQNTLNDLDEVLSSTSVSALRKHPDYDAAKKGGNIPAAKRVVQKFLKQEVVQELKDRIDADGRDPVFVPIVAQEGESLNALPLELAVQLQDLIGGTIYTEVVKSSDRNNTDATAEDRARTTHKWNGIRPSGLIILVDDTYTSGQTLKSLEGYLGRDVGSVVTLSSGRYGKGYNSKDKLPKALEKAGITQQTYEEYYPNGLTGAQLQQYILNGARGEQGLIRRFPPQTSADESEAVQGTSESDAKSAQGQGQVALSAAPSFIGIPRTLTYFSGGGLVEEGLRGIINPVAAVEFDPDIAAAYKDAHGDHITIDDINNVDPASFGEIDYFHASPVCKNSSLLKSKKKGGGEKVCDITAAKSTARVIKESSPSVVTIENVPAYAKTKAAKIIRDALNDEGYIFDEGVYDASEYGAPTSRKRYLVRATRNGLLPDPVKVDGPGWYETIEDIIDELPNSSIARAKYIHRSLPEQGVDPFNVDEPLLVSGTTLFKKVAFSRPNEPAFTFKATHRTVDRILFPDGRVKKATARAKARMTGLPDSYKLPEDEKLGLTIVGNGVPPDLVRNVFGPLFDGYQTPTQPSTPLRAAPTVTPSQNAEYMSALQSGDIQKARQMVDAAAKAAGYDVGPVYHGSNVNNITQFSTDDTFLGKAFFSSSKDLAKEFEKFSTRVLGGEGRVYSAYLKNPESKPTTEFGIDSIEYAVSRPNQIKSADFVTFDSDGNIIPLSERFDEQSDSILRAAPTMPALQDDLGFYSGVESVITEKMPRRATPQQVMGILNPAKNPVKKAELDWMGIEEWMQGKQQVEKDDVLEFVRANKVRFEEVEKGDLDYIKIAKDYGYEPFWDTSVFQMRLKDKDGNLVGKKRDASEPVEFYGDQAELDAAKYGISLARGVDGIGAVEETKYSRYTIPGGENYREILLTLPDRAREFPTFEEWQDDIDPEYQSLDEEGRREVYNAQLLWAKSEDRSNYRSQHWDDPNVVAHMRVDDRVDSEGNKVLFIQEIQSDWAGDINKKGARDDAEVNRLESELAEKEKQVDSLVAEIDQRMGLTVAVEPRDKWFVVIDPNYPNRTDGRTFASKADAYLLAIAIQDRLDKRAGRNTPSAMVPVFDRFKADLERLDNEINDLQVKLNGAKEGIPNMPYAKTYHELALKRLLLMATEQGYDKIALTTGKQQIDLYTENLRQNIQEIAWNKDDRGNINVRAIKESRTGEIVFNEDFIDGKLEGRGKSLDEVVGKTIADQIRNSEESSGNITGDNLSIGGHFHKLMYDQMIPSFLNKFAKKWGGKVSTSELGGRKKITQEMIDDAYARRDFEEGERLTEEMEQQELGTEMTRDKSSAGEATLTQPSLEITPAMRESIQTQGVPLFAAPTIQPLQYSDIPMSATEVLYKDSEILPKPSKKRKNEKVAELLADVAEKHWGRKITSDDITPEEMETIIQIGVAEFEAAFNASGKSAANWYSTAIEAAMAVAGVIHPELVNAELASQAPGFQEAENPADGADLVMRMALAITSQNLSVELNTRFAEEQFEIFKQTGKFDSSKVYGEKAESISGNLALANDLIQTLGFDGAREFVRQEFTVRDLKKVTEKLLGRKVSITGKLEDSLNGAAIFGPKIGQGFLQNVMGNFTPVTIDLWMRRTWGRWTGDVVGSGATPTRLARLLDAARDYGLSLGPLKDIRAVDRKGVTGKNYRTVSDKVANRLETDFEFATDVLGVAREMEAMGQTHYRLSRLPTTQKKLDDLASGDLSYKAFIRNQQTNKRNAEEAFEKATTSARKRGELAFEKAKEAARKKGEKAYENAKVDAKKKGEKLPKKSDFIKLPKKSDFIKLPKKSDFIKGWYAQKGFTAEIEKASKIKPDWSNAASTIVNALKPIDVPAPSDRRVISEVINEIRTRLLEKGYETTNADVQAVLWYPEKDLWAKLRGEEESNLKSSYDEQFIKIAKSRGLGAKAFAAAKSVESKGGGTARSGRSSERGSEESNDQGTVSDGKVAEGDQDGVALRAAPTITPEQDAAYMDAVQSGDMDTAQRMVDEAARKAGKHFGKWFHGSPQSERFEVFSPKPERSFGVPFNSIGSWFTLDEAQARSFAEEMDGEGQLYASYIFTKNPREFISSEGTADGWDVFEEFMLKGTGKPELSRLTPAEVEEKKTELQVQGFDGITFQTEQDTMSENASKNQVYLVAFNPNQIKSADPITRDSDGNVIPLSQRFDEQSDSILRAAPTLSEADYARHAELEAKHDAGTITPEETAEAERIVEEAAQGAGFNVKGWHGRATNWNTYDPKEDDPNFGGFFVADNQEAAQKFAKFKAEQGGEPNVLEVYIKQFNPIDLNMPMWTVSGILENEDAHRLLDEIVQAHNFWVATEAPNHAWGEPVEPVLLENEPAKSKYGKSPAEKWEKARSQDILLHALSALGIGQPSLAKTIRFIGKGHSGTKLKYTDGMQFEDGEQWSAEFTQNMVTSAEQIKSAEPFTGVPLSERFDPSEDSILRAAPTVTTTSKTPDPGNTIFDAALRSIARTIGNAKTVGDVKKIMAGLYAKPFAEPVRRGVDFLLKQGAPLQRLPQEVRSLMNELRAKQSLGGERAMDVIRSVKGNSKFSDLHMPPELANNKQKQKQLFMAMDKNWADKENAPKLENFSQEIQDYAQQLREILIKTGEAAVAAGRMHPDTFLAMKEGYMPHYYYQHEKAKQKLGGIFLRMKLGIEDIMAQRQSMWRIEDQINKGADDLPLLVDWDDNGKGRPRFRSRQHRDAFYEEMILEKAANRIRLRSRVKIFSGDSKRMSHNVTPEDLKQPHKLTPELRGYFAAAEQELRQQYRKKDPLTLEQQEEAGLIMDPVYAIARHVAQMEHDNATAEFFNQINENPEWVADEERSGFVQLPRSRRLGRLSGKFVQEKIAEEITELVNVPDAAARMYDGLLTLWKTGKTVYNPGTHVRNVMGNVLFAQMAGINPLDPRSSKYYKEAFLAIRNGGPLLEEMLEGGVLGADFLTAELRKEIQQVLPEDMWESDDFTLKMSSVLSRAFKKVGGQKAQQFIEGAYQLEDELFKAAAYIGAKDKGMINQDAALHVRKWFPYYDNIGNSFFIKGMKRGPMPFFSFYRESIRILATAAKERPFTLAASMALPAYLSKLSAVAALPFFGLDLDDDEWAEIKDTSMRGKGRFLLRDEPLFSILLPYRNSEGKAQQWDLTNVMPFASLLGRKLEMDNGVPAWQQWALEMISGSPITGIPLEMAFNKNTFTNKPIWEENMTTGEKYSKAMDHVWTKSVPPLAPGGTGFKTLARSGERRTDKSLETRDPVQSVLRAAVGLDVRSASPNIYDLAENFRKQEGLPKPEFIQVGSTAVGRARKAVWEEVAQTDENRDNDRLVRNLAYLSSEDKPIRTKQDINRLLFFRNPLMVIDGEDNQRRFLRSLTPEAKKTLEKSLKDFDEISRKAGPIIMKANRDVRRLELKQKGK